MNVKVGEELEVACGRLKGTLVRVMELMPGKKTPRVLVLIKRSGRIQNFHLTMLQKREESVAVKGA